MSSLINILWFDDDLRPKSDGRTPERLRLQPWLRWFSTRDRPQNFCLVEAHTLERFADELRQRASLRPEDDQYIHAVLLDFMWRGHKELATTFEAVGFPDQQVNALDAGAQLFCLITCKALEEKRPEWLRNYSTRDIGILTTQRDIAASETLLRYGEGNALRNASILHKDFDLVEQQATPSLSFLSWLEQICIKAGHPWRVKREHLG